MSCTKGNFAESTIRQVRLLQTLRMGSYPRKGVIMKSSYKGGYMGKILMVDLSSGKISEADLPSDDVLRKYIGCWGLGLRYLYDLLPPGYTASDPEF